MMGMPPGRYSSHGVCEERESELMEDVDPHMPSSDFQWPRVLSRFSNGSMAFTWHQVLKSEVLGRGRAHSRSKLQQETSWQAVLRFCLTALLSLSTPQDTEILKLVFFLVVRAKSCLNPWKAFFKRPASSSQIPTLQTAPRAPPRLQTDFSLFSFSPYLCYLPLRLCLPMLSGCHSSWKTTTRRKSTCPFSSLNEEAARKLLPSLLPNLSSTQMWLK